MTAPTLLGLHHVTLVAANAQRTADFYTQVLGLRLIKTTVNFDDPGSYHLYFADETGNAGTVVTFFEWPRAPKGHPGIGGTHHVALRVADRDALLRWKRRLRDLGVAVKGPYDRRYFTSIYFRDPDGVILEIATDGPGMLFDEVGEVVQRTPPADLMRGNRDEAAIASLTWPEPVTAIDDAMQLTRGMHHLTAIAANVERTDEFLRGVLGLTLVKKTENFDDPGTRHWSWGSPDARPGSLVTYLEKNPARERRAQMGTGQGHHYALAVADEMTQLAYRDKLLDANLPVSEVMDRVYFKSIYTRDPDGHIVEIATMGPGFLVDESAETAGTALQLPWWLEAHREQIAAHLEPLAHSRSVAHPASTV
ncbi:MAG: VOC family protein [Gemmatimonadaceae bacterium]|nr:VOC family protein [Gemmatimonadaceae bacterium]